MFNMADYKTLTDLLVGGLFAITVAVSAGVADVSIFDTSLTEVLYTFGPATVDWASTLSIAALGFAYLSNVPRLDRMTTEELGLSAIAILIVAIGMIEPGFAASNMILGLFTLGLAAGGYWAVQYGG